MHDCDAAVRAHNRHFNPQLNPDYEHFKLRQACQQEGETVDMFFARLSKLASSCTGIDKQFEIRAQLIQGCRSSELLKLILRQPGISLDDILILGSSHKLADARTGEMESALAHRASSSPPRCQVKIKEERVEAIRKWTGRGSGNAGAHPGDKACGNCGMDSHPPRGFLAIGKPYLRCGKLGHFTQACLGAARSVNIGDKTM